MKQFEFPKRKLPKMPHVKVNIKSANSAKTPTAEDFLSLAVSKKLLDADAPQSVTTHNKPNSRANSRASGRITAKRNISRKLSNRYKVSDENNGNYNKGNGFVAQQTEVDQRPNRGDNVIIPNKYITGNKYVPKKEDIDHLVMVGPHMQDKLKHSLSDATIRADEHLHLANEMPLEIGSDVDDRSQISQYSMSSLVSNLSSGSTYSLAHATKEEEKKHSAAEFFDAVVHVAPIIPPPFFSMDEPRYKSTLSANTGDGRGVNAGIASVGRAKHLTSTRSTEVDESTTNKHAEMKHKNDEMVSAMDDVLSVEDTSIQHSESISSINGLESLPPNCALIPDDERSVVSVESVYTAYNTQRQEQTIKVMNSQVVSKQYRNGGSILKGTTRYDLAVARGTKSNNNNNNSAISSTKRLVKSIPLLASLEKTSKVSSGQAAVRAKRAHDSSDEGYMWTYAPIAATAEAPWLRNKTNATNNNPKSLYKIYSSAVNLPTQNGNELNTKSIDSTVWKEKYSQKLLPENEYNLEQFSSKIIIPIKKHKEYTDIADPVVRQQVQMDNELLSSVRMPVGIKVVNHKKWDDEKNLRTHVTDSSRFLKNIRTQNHLVRVSFENFTENCRKGKLQLEKIPTKLPSVVYPLPFEDNNINESIEEHKDINDNNTNDDVLDDISEVSEDSIHDIRIPFGNDRKGTGVDTGIGMNGIEYNYKMKEDNINDDSTYFSLMSDNTHHSQTT